MPTQGSTKGECCVCGTEVWVGPNQIKMLEKEPTMAKWCFRCVLRSAEEHPEILASIRPAGRGGGHSYLIIDSEPDNNQQEQRKDS